MKKHLNIQSKTMGVFRNLCPLSLMALFFIIASFQVSAQVYPEQYLEEALENNPGLRAMRAEHEADLSKTVISSALPDPELTAGFFTPPMERLMGNQWVDVGIMQMFPWFGTLGKQKAAAEKMADGTWHKYRQERNSLFMNLTRLWLQIFEKEQKLILLEGFVKILEDREDLIYTRYAGGEQSSGLALDLYRLEIQLSGLKNQAEKLQEEKKALTRSFNILVGRDETAEVKTPEIIPEAEKVDLPLYADQEKFAGNPGLNIFQSGAQAAEIQKEVSRLQTRPMFGVGVQYSYFAPGDAAMNQMDGGHMLMPMVSVSLPIFGNKNQAIRQQSLLKAESAGFREKDQLNALQTEWTQLMAELKNLQRDFDFYKNQAEITRKTWDLVLTAYAGGEEGFDELLRIQDQLLELEWRLLETHVKQNIIKAETDQLQAKNIFE